MNARQEVVVADGEAAGAKPHQVLLLRSIRVVIAKAIITPIVYAKISDQRKP